MTEANLKPSINAFFEDEITEANMSLFNFRLIIEC